MSFRIIPPLAFALAMLLPWLDSVSDVSSELCDIDVEMATGACVYTSPKVAVIIATTFAALLLGAVVIAVIRAFWSRLALRPLAALVLCAATSTAVCALAFTIALNRADALPALPVLLALSFGAPALYVASLRLFRQ